MNNPALHVLLAGRFDPAEREAWWRALTAAAPECIWQRDDAPFDREVIDAAVVANPAAGLLASLPNLRFVQSLWAGVDKLLADATLPVHLPIARMVDPAMNAAMAETALWAVLGLHRRFFDYAAQQRQVQWQQLPQRRADDVSVLVLGAGQMGGEVAARLAAQGYRVSTWRRRSAVSLLEVVTGQGRHARCVKRRGVCSDAAWRSDREPGARRARGRRRLARGAGQRPALTRCAGCVSPRAFARRPRFLASPKNHRAAPCGCAHR
jgi:hypothetical protein